MTAHRSPPAGQAQGRESALRGALQASIDRRFLLVADAGSGQVSVLRIRRDGSLREVEGSPVSSGGSMPVTIAVHNDLVFVGNGGTVSNYAGFRLGEGGQLQPRRERGVLASKWHTAWRRALRW